MEGDQYRLNSGPYGGKGICRLLFGQGRIARADTGHCPRRCRPRDYRQQHQPVMGRYTDDGGKPRQSGAKRGVDVGTFMPKHAKVTRKAGLLPLMKLRPRLSGLRLMHLGAHRRGYSHDRRRHMVAPSLSASGHIHDQCRQALNAVFVNAGTAAVITNLSCIIIILNGSASLTPTSIRKISVRVVGRILPAC